MNSLNRLSNGSKAVALVLFATSLFVFGSSYFDSQVVRSLCAAPLVLLAISQFFFRYPAFMNQAFYDTAERDAQRCLFSIKNLGMLIILMVAALLFLAE